MSAEHNSWSEYLGSPMRLWGSSPYTIAKILDQFESVVRASIPHLQTIAKFNPNASENDFHKALEAVEALGKIMHEQGISPAQFERLLFADSAAFAGSATAGMLDSAKNPLNSLHLYERMKSDYLWPSAITCFVLFFGAVIPPPDPIPSPPLNVKFAMIFLATLSLTVPIAIGLALKPTESSEISTPEDVERAKVQLNRLGEMSQRTGFGVSGNPTEIAYQARERLETFLVDKILATARFDDPENARKVTPEAAQFVLDWAGKMLGAAKRPTGLTDADKDLLREAKASEIWLKAVARHGNPKGGLDLLR